MTRRLLILSSFLLASPLHGASEYWEFWGFGSPLVQCRLVGNQTRNCRFLNSGPQQLDGVMEAIHRATKRGGE